MPDTEPSLIRRADAVLVADSAARGLPVATRWWLILLPFVATVALILTVPHPRLYHFLIEEDHIIEWLQFAAILGASVVFGFAGAAAWRSGRRNLGLLFALVAVGAFVVSGEEISWGQRILGLETPQILEDINHQGETNVHNISGVQRVFNIGELLAGLYGFAMPLALLVPRIRDRIGRFLDPLIVPPLALASLFFLPFAYRAFRAVFLPEAGERITEFGELPELTLYLGILITGLVVLRGLRAQRSTRRA